MESAAGKQAVKEFFIQIRKSFSETVSWFNLVYLTLLIATGTSNSASEVFAKTVLSISTDGRRIASATSLREVGYFLPKI